MNGPVRLTVVMTHPVQYSAPWFRYLANECEDLELTVVYAAAPDAAQQGTGFDSAFEWDVPLTDGYDAVVVRPVLPGAVFHSSAFRGVDVPEIGRAIAATSPDIVLIPGWNSITLLRAAVWCRLRGIPVLYRGDSNLYGVSGAWRRAARFVRTWLLLRLFSGYLSVGQRAREYLERHGVHGSRILAAPHCVDNDFFRSAVDRFSEPAARAACRARFGCEADEFVVLFVGKFIDEKRPADLLRAAARLGSGTRLLMVGAGPLAGALQDLARSLDVKVTWAGFLNQSELGAAYAAADCLALPSEHETWGLVVNEALATGLPCVASDGVGCAPDLIRPGETGETFPAGDTEAFAAALGRVRDAPADAGRRSACMRTADAFSFGAAAAGLRAACQRFARRREQESRPARVLALCGGMVTIGGAERMTFEVLRVAREAGAAVHVITNDWEFHRIAAAAESLGGSWSRGFYQHGISRRMRSPLRIAAACWGVIRTSAGLMRSLVRFRPTRILIADFRSVLVNAPALALARAFGVPVVFRVPNAPEPGAFYRRLWKYLIDPFVDVFVAHSRFTSAELQQHGIAPRKVERVRNAVARRDGGDATDVPDGGRTIIYAGQIIPEKGVHVLLDAIAVLVRNGHTDVRLQVVGAMDGWESPSYHGYRDSIRRRASERDLAGRVEFLGWREDVPALMSRAAVHCCPSQPEQRESFGNVTLEAKHGGIPSVVTPSGGLPELIRHRIDGWVCEDFSADALADGIAYFLIESNRKRAGREARASLAAFSVQRFSASWRRLLGLGAGPESEPQPAADAEWRDGARTAAPAAGEARAS